MPYIPIDKLFGEVDADLYLQRLAGIEEKGEEKEDGPSGDEHMQDENPNE